MFHVCSYWRHVDWMGLVYFRANMLQRACQWSCIVIGGLYKRERGGLPTYMKLCGRFVFSCIVA